jgi:hypothetical protein
VADEGVHAPLSALEAPPLMPLPSPATGSAGLYMLESKNPAINRQAGMGIMIDLPRAGDGACKLTTIRCRLDAPGAPLMDGTACAEDPRVQTDLVGSLEGAFVHA